MIGRVRGPPALIRLAVEIMAEPGLPTLLLYQACSGL